MKKVLVILLVFCLFPWVSVLASDDAMETLAPAAFPIDAKSGILISADTGAVLYDKNIHEQMPPASITKIMTLLLTMEALEAGKITLQDQVTVSAHAASMGGTQIWLKEHEVMCLEDLLKACAVASANDAAMALAEYVGGSEENFVAMMNEKAQALGMTDTVFINPTGLDADGHVSSACDIAAMSRALLSYPKITEYTSIWMDTLREGQTQLVNTNKLVRFYQGCNGLKTGTTDGAGSCLSVSASRNGMTLIAVVMGSQTTKERFDSGRKLLDYGFATFALYTPEPDPVWLTPVSVNGGVLPTVTPVAQDMSPLLIPKGKEKAILQEVTFCEELQAPVTEGQELGEVRYLLDGELLATRKLVAGETVEAMTLWRSFCRLFSRLVTM